jgi:3-oxoacyl-[acyl-carrier protein] reductase
MERSGRGEAEIRAQFCRETGITGFGIPQDVAGLVSFIVSRNGGWLHGATIDLDGGEIAVL